MKLRRFRDTRIRVRLMIVCLLIALIPLTSVAWLSASGADEALNQATRASQKALEHQVTQQLSSLRAVKRAGIERYFGTIVNQMQTFAENRMVVDAMRDFRQCFRTFREETKVGDAEIRAMRESLTGYYQRDFASEYKKKNDGRAVDTQALLRGLDDDSIVLQHAYISGNPHPLGSKHELDQADDATEYGKLHGEVHPVIRNYLEKFGYYDIFLVDHETGDIVYSVFKELDYTTSLSDGPYAGTNFGEAFRKASSGKSKGEFVLVDFAQYLPSYEAPASFIASPIFDGNEKVGVAIFQMPLDRISLTMNERAGLGETGETYLVGPDYLMRSDSFRAPETHSVDASFRDPEKGAIKSPMATAALAGETGSVTSTSYTGAEVISSYGPIDIQGLSWAILAEIETEEAFAPIGGIETKAEASRDDLNRSTILVVLGAAAAIVAVALWLSGMIAKPLNDAVVVLEDVANGNLDRELEVDSKDELGLMASAVNNATSSMRKTLRLIDRTSGTLSSSAGNLGDVSQQLSGNVEESSSLANSVSGAAEQASSRVETVASSAEEMRASIQEIARNTGEASSVAEEAVGLASQTNDAILRLSKSSAEVGNVVKLITSIAEQTNLLALNATIEAARAGEAGKGFTVVANEVKELAKETAKATEEISGQITTIQGDTEEAVEAITQISTTIERISSFQTSISAAVEEQSATTDEISRNMVDAAADIRGIASNISSVATGAESTSASAQNVSGATTNIRGISQELRLLVDQFTFSAGDGAEQESSKVEEPVAIRDPGHTPSELVEV